MANPIQQGLKLFISFIPASSGQGPQWLIQYNKDWNPEMESLNTQTNFVPQWLIQYNKDWNNPRHTATFQSDPARNG